MHTAYTRTFGLLTVAGFMALPSFVSASEIPMLCADVSVDEVGADCALYYSEDGLLGVVFEYDLDKGEVIVAHIDLDKHEMTHRSDPVPADVVNFAPFLFDLNGDGVQEILFDTHAHDSNISYDVWTFDDASQRYTRYGEYYSTNGPENFKEENGFLMSYSPITDTTYDIFAEMMGADGFLPVYSALVDVDKGTCTVNLNGPGRDLGLDQAKLEADCAANIDYEFLNFPAYTEVWCDAVPAGEAGVDCGLFTGDVEVWFVYAGDALSVTQYLNGETIASDEGIEVFNPAYAPVLADLDGIEPMEILVPVTSGNVNTEFQVWSVNDVEYSAKGSIMAPSPESIEMREGLIFSSERANAYTSFETASMLTSHGIVSVYDLETNFSKEPGSYCSLSESDGFSAHGLDAAAILAQCEKDAAKALE